MPAIETFEHALAATALVFLIGFAIFLVYSIWRGRRLMRRFAAAYPSEYEAAGQPWPVYFGRLRQQHYQTFLMQRGYQHLPDPALLAAFEVQRRWEVGLLAFLVGGFLLLGGAVVWLKYIAD